jgi:hypothetical protein
MFHGLGTLLLIVSAATAQAQAQRDPSALTISWQDNCLTISSERLPSGELKINYLEAYCRNGSTDRDWSATVIGHTTRVTSAAADGREIRLQDVLRDGVVVDHAIRAGSDEVDFRLLAQNPTDKPSLAHWAQPCIRVDRFTGCSPDEARELFPSYIRQCFVFVDGQLTRLPTQPWARQARYTPGQVYVPRGVNRDDVNPRPVSVLVPSSGLCGCFSADGRQIMAVAWEPYQELFQGVITCLHSDFRIGGLEPGETRQIRGKLYLVQGDDVDALVQRYERDFPEHVNR